MSDMSKNTNLEIAVEIMAAKIAKMSREGYTAEDDKMKKLIDERFDVVVYWRRGCNRENNNRIRTRNKKRLY